MEKKKTWLTVIFKHGKAKIEASFNYDTKTYYLSHGSNDKNVTFTNEDKDINISIDRAKCVMAALKFIREETQPH